MSRLEKARQSRPACAGRGPPPKSIGLIGTGFAQPKPLTTSMSDPNGSRWARGLRVKRPLRRGGRSPSWSADQACANSCTVKAITSVTIRVIREGQFSPSIVVRLYHPADGIIRCARHWEGVSMLPDLKMEDVLRLRKPHPCGSTDWIVRPPRRRHRPEMPGLRPAHPASRREVTRRLKATGSSRPHLYGCLSNLRILFLFSDTGGGHRSAAEAVDRGPGTRLSEPL